VVGYYRPISRWNDGKRTEFKMRTPYAGLNNLHSAVVPNPVTKPKANATRARDKTIENRRVDKNVYAELSF
jgi:hypothetical protein